MKQIHFKGQPHAAVLCHLFALCAYLASVAAESQIYDATGCRFHFEIQPGSTYDDVAYKIQTTGSSRGRSPRGRMAELERIAYVTRVMHSLTCRVRVGNVLPSASFRPSFTVQTGAKVHAADFLVSHESIPKYIFTNIVYQFAVK